MKEIIKRIRIWDKENPGPYKIQINPTNRCNLECKFCWQRTNKEINYSEVNDERYLDLIEEAKSLGVREIEITGGGEPLLRKDLTIQLIEKIKRKGMKGKLITNGTEFDRKDLQKIVKSGWEEIIFSVDGAKRTHNQLRQVEGCFEETISSMKELKNMRNEGKPDMTIHMVLCKDNHNEINEVLKTARDIECDNFFIEPVVILALDTDVENKLKMNREELEAALENLEEGKKEADKEGLNHNFRDIKRELIERTNKMNEVIEVDVDKQSKNHSKGGRLENAACFEPWYNMIIRPEGDAGPCCMFDNQGPNIKENSLEKIWFGDYFERIRKRMIEHNLLSFCSKCNPSQVSENRRIRKCLQNG